MRRIYCILLAALTLSTSSHALVYVVPNGTTETTTLSLPNEGDKAIIERGGTIDVRGTAGANGVEMNAANQQVFNQGRILTLGDNLGGGDGIFSVVINGNNIVIKNGGLISTRGDAAIGILNFVVGDNVVIKNGGLISTEDDISDGIHSTVVGSNALVVNSGLISTSGDTSRGIFSQISEDNMVIKNTGTISTQGISAHGILSIGDQVQIINSGTIRSAQANAISISGINPTLNLLRGSNLQGLVESDNPLNLNVETGLNLALSLANGSSFATLGIEAPFALAGDDLIAVIDPTGLAMQPDVVADLSDTILDGIYLHRIGFPCCLPCGCGIWVQGTGSSRKRSHSKDFVGYHNRQAGFLVGYDGPLWGGYGGLFGGASFGKAKVSKETQKADTTSYVGGVTYEWLCSNTFIGTALAAGYVDWHNERYVMYNLANEGVQKARANTGGGYVTADVTAARYFDLLCGINMSVSLRYAGLFLGNYHEKGSISNLFVKNRVIDLITTRYELSLPWRNSSHSCCWSVEPYVGVYGRYQLGGKRVNAALLEQSLNFDPGSPRNLVAFLFGFRGVQSIGCFELFLNLEGNFDNRSSTRILGEGGIGLSF